MPALVTHLAQASEHHRAGHTAEAETLYRRILADAPDHPDALNRLGVLLCQAGRAAEALPLLRRLAERCPDEPSVHYNLGGALREAGEADAARRAYEAVLRVAPGHAPACYNLGATLLDLDRPDDALGAFRAAVAADPDHLNARRQLARLLIEHGANDEAVVHLRHAVRREPEALDLRMMLARAAFASGSLDEAIEQFEHATRLAPRDVEAWTNLGLARHAHGAIGAAARAFETVLELDPRAVPALLGLARTHLDRDDPGRAVACCEEALAVDATSIDAHRIAAHGLAAAGELDEAVRHLEVARADAPGSAALAAQLAELHRARGRYDDAERLYAEAAAAPGHADVMARQVEMALERGDVTRATALAEHVREASPEAAETALVMAKTALADRRPADAVRVLEERLEGDDLAPGQRRILLFKLGEAHDAAGDHEAAWAAFHRGNELRETTFDREVARREIDAIIAAFPGPPPVPAPTPEAAGSVRPVFITGLPRTGKTLLEQILCGHPRVAGGGEMGLLKRIADRAAALTDCAFPSCLERITPVHLRSLAAFAQAELAAVAARTGAAGDVTPDVVTDTDPTNFLLVGLIPWVLPEARVICCLRDPLDTCLSCYFKTFRHGHGYTYDLRDLGFFYGEHRRLLAHWERTSPLPVHTLVYETLVEDLPGTMRAVLAFCDLPWDEACLAFHENPRPVYTASASQVRQPLFRSHVGRHRHYDRHLGPLRDALAEAGVGD